MERSHIPLNKWLMGFYLLNASKKGMSAHQLHRALGLDYKSAWFMCHRIREAMRAGDLGPLGGGGMIVEADETYYGPVDKPAVPRRLAVARSSRRHGPPTSALSSPSLSAAATSAHSMCRSPSGEVTRSSAKISPASPGCTPTKATSIPTSARRSRHRTVKHSAGEYVRYDGGVISHQYGGRLFLNLQTRNEGVYQHCKEKHFIGIWPSSISATITAWRSATATSTAPLPQSKAWKASA